jgi:hypothetical protein
MIYLMFYLASESNRRMLVHNSKVSENEIARKLFGPWRQEVKEYRKLHKEESHNLCPFEDY